MRTIKSFLLLLLVAAVALPSSADGRQIRRLKDRAKNRAKQRAEQKVNQKADQAVDKMVDKAMAKAEKSISDAFTDAFTKSNTTYDPETGVLSREGLQDIKLEPNAQSPARSDYLHYLNVSKTKLPSLDGSSKDVYFAEDVYYYKNRQLTDDGKQGTLLDVNDATYTLLMHETSSYWSMKMAQFAEVMQAQMDSLDQAVGEMQAQRDEDETGNPDVEMSFSVRTENTGRSDVVHGVPADQYVVVVETRVEATDVEEGDQSFAGKFFSVMEIWATNKLAGSETMQEFGKQMMESWGEAMGGEGMGDMFSGKFPDARFGASAERATKEFQKVEGFPVSTTMYMVVAGEDAELDVDAVLASKDAAPSFEAMAASMSGAGDRIQGQTTVLTTTMFVSNMSTDPFDPDRVAIPSTYTEVANPMASMSQD